jgi:hypothetical protein
MKLFEAEAADMCVPYLDGQQKNIFKLKQKMYFQQKFNTFFKTGEYQKCPSF